VWLATTVTLAASLMVAMVASGAHPKVVRAGLAIAATDLGASITIALTQVGRFQEIPLGNEPAPDAARDGRNWPPD
jgi:hypothetical protein